MAKNLKSFVDKIEREHPDLLLRIKEEVNPVRFEITALLSLLEKKGREKMVFFEKALSVDGGNLQPLIFNVFFSKGRQCAQCDQTLPPYSGLSDEPISKGGKNDQD